MQAIVEKDLEHLGESRGVENHDHDLVQELSKRLDALWRFDQYICNADGKPEIQDLWRDLKSQETNNVRRIKDLVAKEIQEGCF